MSSKSNILKKDILGQRVRNTKFTKELKLGRASQKMEMRKTL